MVQRIVARRLSADGSARGQSEHIASGRHFYLPMLCAGTRRRNTHPPATSSKLPMSRRVSDIPEALPVAGNFGLLIVISVWIPAMFWAFEAGGKTVPVGIYNVNACCDTFSTELTTPIEVIARGSLDLLLITNGLP